MVALTPDQDGYEANDAASGRDAEAEAPAWTPPAWEDVVREHGDRVYRLAYRLSGNQHDAEDITQETFIRVFRSLANYKPGSFEGWLHRITTNVFLDLVRRRQRIRMEALGEESDRVVGREPSPEQVFSDSNLDPDLQAALDDLLPEFRAAVVLCDVEGLTYEEIGSTLGVKIGTVRSRIHRGRQALRAGLERRRAARFAESGTGSVTVSAAEPAPEPAAGPAVEPAAGPTVEAPAGPIVEAPAENSVKKAAEPRTRGASAVAQQSRRPSAVWV